MDIGIIIFVYAILLSGIISIALYYENNRRNNFSKLVIGIITFPFAYTAISLVWMLIQFIEAFFK